MGISYTVFIVIAAFTFSTTLCWASVEKPGKLPVIHGPLSNSLPGPSAYLRAMMKYNITPTQPGALPYNEILNRRLSPRNLPIGYVDAQFPNSAGYRSPIIVGEGDDAKTFF